MAALSGTLGSIVFTTGGTTVVGEMKEWSLDMQMDTPDATAFGDTWREFVSGIKTWTGSFSGNFDGSDSAQTSLRSAFLAGSVCSYRFAVDSSHYFAGSALINGQSPSTSFDGLATTEFSIQGTGALTYT